MAATATKKKAAAKPALHPPYVDMAVAAIAALKERKGSSKIAIGKYVTANYKLGGDLNSVALKKALKTGVAKGILLQVKGTGANGSFKVAAAKKVEKKVKAKPKAAKKPAAKKPAAKTAKKPASKKKAASPKKKATPKKKAGKSPAKKTTPTSKKAASKKKSPKKAAPKKK